VLPVRRSRWHGRDGSAYGEIKRLSRRTMVSQLNMRWRSGRRDPSSSHSCNAAAVNTALDGSQAVLTPASPSGSAVNFCVRRSDLRAAQL